MAVTIEKRPIGVVLGSAVTANINQDYSSAFATVNKTAHGLSDGQYIYIKSNVENYNGFFRIDVTNANEFLLIDAPYVAWITDANITYYPQQSTHGWSCVHLPIVYELSNTRYPVNSVDTARTVSTIANDGGYLRVNLSGSLGTFEELSFLKITNANNSDLNGIYQIVDKISTSAVVINLAYSVVTNAGIVGATVQLYYQNYVINVRVYAGINSAHEWATLKPYELAATLQFVPDSNNRVKFSVSDILKSYTELSNNLTLPSLPNNVDAWTQFYIEVAEQYDSSNGYTVNTTRSGYASDQSNFEGYASNAKLPFKNIHSGSLSEYVMPNSAAKFLTLFSIPVLFGCTEDAPDCYNELSFIKDTYLPVTLSRTYYQNDSLVNSESVEVSGSPGVYRYPLSPNCSYDRMDAVIIMPEVDQVIQTAEIAAAPTALGDNILYPTGTINWSSSQVTMSYAGGPPTNIYSYVKTIPFEVQKGSVTLDFEINVTLNSGSPTATELSVTLLDSDGNRIGNPRTIDTGITTGSVFDTNVFTASKDVFYIRLQQKLTSIAAANITILVDAITVTAPEYTSETKQFTIDCGCANQELRLMWLNNLGGFDQWKFTGETEHAINILDSGETEENTFPSWPNSYGEFADTVNKQTYRDSANRKFVYSQLLTQDEADAIAFIKSSPLVQIVNSRTDRRTVIVDTESFTKYKDGDKTYTVQFNIRYTDNIPSQTA